MQEEVAIVIPIHKNTSKPNELIALKQALKILKNRNIFFLTKESLTIDTYQIDEKRIIPIVRVADESLASNTSYNKLMLSPKFYFIFKQFKYILIYQLDAFIFEDKLDFFCSKNYDYIGAPWVNVNFPILHYQEAMQSKYFLLKKFKKILLSKKISEEDYPWVGNGGFSLRKVKSFMQTSKSFSFLFNDFKDFDGSEDIIWSIYVPLFFRSFKIAPVKIAREFAFELEPKLCYEENNFQLPMGCHAWEKYDLEFWRPFFEKENFYI